MAPVILAVNPWIHDFAAYDFWAKPLGLLYLAGILRGSGCRVFYIDCLDRFHPRNSKRSNSQYGKGHYLKTEIAKPAWLEDVPRRFSRYGISPDILKKDLLNIAKPDLILVTSIMTYWASGVKETIGVLKEVFPDVPVVLGGIYASLCRGHAEKYCGADEVFTGAGEKDIFNIVKKYTWFSPAQTFNPDDFDSFPYPAFELQNKIPYVPVLTSKGCPFSCSYCASGILNPVIKRRSADSAAAEIAFWHKKFAVKDFAFYDDALLVDFDQHAKFLFEKIINMKSDIRFHTPNALHIREISKKTATLMFKAGFETIRLGFETADFEKRKSLDKKVKAGQLEQAVRFLKEAGFKSVQIGAYILAGLPEQTADSVIKSADIVKNTGINPIIAYYSPVPKTALWKKAVESSRYNLEADPIFTNNAIFPCQKKRFSWEDADFFKTDKKHRMG